MVRELTKHGGQKTEESGISFMEIWDKYEREVR